MGRSHSLRPRVALGRSGPVWLHCQGCPFHVIAQQLVSKCRPHIEDSCSSYKVCLKDGFPWCCAVKITRGERVKPMELGEGKLREVQGFIYLSTRRSPYDCRAITWDGQPWQCSQTGPLLLSTTLDLRLCDLPTASG